MAKRWEMKTGPEPRVMPISVPVTEQIAGTAAATAANYGHIFVADDDYELIGVTERHETAGNDAGAVTLMVKKVPSGTAKASGTDMLSAGMNLKATANTNVAGSLHGTVANRRVAAGESIALVTTGTLTTLAGVHVTLWLKRI